MSDAKPGGNQATSGMTSATSERTRATFKIWRSDAADGGGFREYPVTLVPGMVVAVEQAARAGLSYHRQ